MLRPGSALNLSPSQRSCLVNVRFVTQSGQVGSWAVRNIVLNIETGASLEYAEKNGIRNLKSQFNMKPCTIKNLSKEESGKLNSLEVALSDGRMIHLAFDKLESCNEWKGYLGAFATAPLIPSKPTRVPPPPPPPEIPLLEVLPEPPTVDIRPNTNESLESISASATNNLPNEMNINAADKLHSLPVIQAEAEASNKASADRPTRNPSLYGKISRDLSWRGSMTDIIKNEEASRTAEVSKPEKFLDLKIVTEFDGAPLTARVDESTPLETKRPSSTTAVVGSQNPTSARSRPASLKRPSSASARPVLVEAVVPPREAADDDASEEEEDDEDEDEDEDVDAGDEISQGNAIIKKTFSMQETDFQKLVSPRRRPSTAGAAQSTIHFEEKFPEVGSLSIDSSEEEISLMTPRDQIDYLDEAPPQEIIAAPKVTVDAPLVPKNIMSFQRSVVKPEESVPPSVLAAAPKTTSDAPLVPKNIMSFQRAVVTSYGAEADLPPAAPKTTNDAPLVPKNIMSFQKAVVRSTPEVAPADPKTVVDAPGAVNLQKSATVPIDNEAAKEKDTVMTRKAELSSLNTGAAVEPLQLAVETPSSVKSRIQSFKKGFFQAPTEESSSVQSKSHIAEELADLENRKNVKSVKGRASKLFKQKDAEILKEKVVVEEHLVSNMLDKLSKIYKPRVNLPERSGPPKVFKWELGADTSDPNQPLTERKWRSKENDELDNRRPFASIHEVGEEEYEQYHEGEEFTYDQVYEQGDEYEAGEDFNYDEVYNHDPEDGQIVYDEANNPQGEYADEAPFEDQNYDEALQGGVYSAEDVQVVDDQVDTVKDSQYDQYQQHPEDELDQQYYDDANLNEGNNAGEQVNPMRRPMPPPRVPLADSAPEAEHLAPLVVNAPRLVIDEPVSLLTSPQPQQPVNERVFLDNSADTKPAEVIRRSSSRPSSGRLSRDAVDSSTNEHLEIEVVSVLHPAHRLSRRVQVWNFSSGFSFNDMDDVQQFITDLGSSGDVPLANLAQHPSSTFLDWSETMVALREEESQILAQAEQLTDQVNFVINVTFMIGDERVHNLYFDISAKDSPADIAAQIAEVTGIEADFLTIQVAQELPKANNYLHQGYEFLQTELLFAEDLFLYQEEVIDQLSEELKKAKALGKDKQSIEKSQKTVNESNRAAFSDQLPINMKTKFPRNDFARKTTGIEGEGADDDAYYEEEFAKLQLRLKDERGLTMDDWRAWISEKHQLIRSHNAEKSSLVSELRALRQALNPNTEKIYQELRRSENVQESLETELIQSEMSRDAAQNQLQEALERIHQMEVDRKVVEKHYQDQLSELQHHIHLLSADDKAVAIESFQRSAPRPSTAWRMPSVTPPTIALPPKTASPVVMTSSNREESSEAKSSIAVAPRESKFRPELKPTFTLDDIFSPAELSASSKATVTFDWKPKEVLQSTPAIDSQRPEEVKEQRGGLMRWKDVSEKYKPVDENLSDAPYIQLMKSKSVVEVAEPGGLADDDSDLFLNSLDDDEVVIRENPQEELSLSALRLQQFLASQSQMMKKKSNHPLRQALRAELPQLTSIHKFTQDEMRRRENRSGRFMSSTDASKLKTRETITDSSKLQRSKSTWKG